MSHLRNPLCFCRILGAIHNDVSQNVRRLLLIAVALCYLVPGMPRSVLVTLAVVYLIPGLLYFTGVSGKYRCGACHTDAPVPAHAGQ